MPTGGREHGLRAAARRVAGHASALARLELELARLQLKQKLFSLGLGAGLLVGAGVLGLFLVGFGFAALAAGIATVVPVWAALLTVTGALALLVGLLAALGLSRLKKGTPPVPTQAIEEARKTVEALRSSNVHG
jgi:membrane protein implicated in regulation of membrane protease activity